jgi:hypothetical protein
VIGLGPHRMGTGDLVFVAVFQLGLIALGVFAVWLAVRLTRETSRR